MLHGQPSHDLPPTYRTLRLLLVTDSRYRRYILCSNFFRTVTVVATRCMEVYWCLGEHPGRRLGLYKDKNLAHESHVSPCRMCLVSPLSAQSCLRGLALWLGASLMLWPSDPVTRPICPIYRDKSLSGPKCYRIGLCPSSYWQ